MSDARLIVSPIDSRETFKDKAYAALRNVIVSSDIYRSRTDLRLDERQLAQDFGISRTRCARRWHARARGLRALGAAAQCLCHKTRASDRLITAWAALESVAARLITQTASGKTRGLRRVFATFEDDRCTPSSTNTRGEHQLPPDDHRAGRQPHLGQLAENLFTHMRSPPRDDRRGGSRRPLDPRPHEHHPGPRRRHRACRGSGPPAPSALPPRRQARRLSDWKGRKTCDAALKTTNGGRRRKS